MWGPEVPRLENQLEEILENDMGLGFIHGI